MKCRPEALRSETTNPADLPPHDELGQSPYLLRHRNKAVVAVSVREVRLGWKFVRYHVNPTRAG